jgi:hypothetical protein
LRARPLILVALLAACAGDGSQRKEGGSPADATKAPAVPKHEYYLRYPTRIEAEELVAILPAGYGKNIEVKGLSTGWKRAGDRRVWEGAGGVDLRILSFTARVRKLTLTLVPDGPDPEVIFQATGNVRLVRAVKGVGEAEVDLDSVLINNDKRLVID